MLIGEEMVELSCVTIYFFNHYTVGHEELCCLSSHQVHGSQDLTVCMCVRDSLVQRRSWWSEISSGDNLYCYVEGFKCTELKPQYKVHIAASPLYPHWAPCFC